MGRTRWIVAALGGLLVLLIVVPSVLRSRLKGGESPVIGDMRTMASAQATYASLNRGFFDRPGCLARPSTCLPGYSAEQPVFLGEEIASLATRSGYARSFHPGPKAPPEALAKGGISASSLAAFAYVATPTTPGARAFCIDDTGRLCRRLDGKMPEPEGGRCPRECENLQ